MGSRAGPAEGGVQGPCSHARGQSAHWQLSSVSTVQRACQRRPGHSWPWPPTQALLSAGLGRGPWQHMKL